MALNYENLANTAERLIEENGRDLTLIKGSETVADPTKPWREDLVAGETRFTIKGVIVRYDNEDIDGTLIKRGDRQALVAHNSVEDESTGSVIIEKFDRVLDGGVDWKIIEVTSWEPGDTRIFYDMQLRQ